MREYRGTLEGLPNAEVLFLSAGEIAAQLSAGALHLGVTGEDLIRESIPGAHTQVELLCGLGFGNASVVVAVPQAWIDVRTMADLEDVAAAFHARHGRRMRVATKYVTLTRQFFADHGVTDYRIVESLGATEGAPASGAAELIVDITTTGATLSANALKVLDDGTILVSEANLVASLKASWTPRALETARAIFSRMAAEERARAVRAVRASLPGDLITLENRARTDFGASVADVDAEARVMFHCPTRQAPALADFLVASGAGMVTVSSLDYVFSKSNALQDRLLARLG